MNIKYYSNFINENFENIEVNESVKTYNDLIRESKLPYTNYLIYADDECLEYPECKDVDIKETKTDIIVCLKIENGKGFVDYIKNPLNIIMAAVAVALIIFTGGAGTFGVMGIGMATGVGIGMLGALFTPKLSTMESDNSVGKNRYSLSGGTNQSQLDKPFPMVLGQALVVPPFVANYYVGMDDKTSGSGEQYLYALLNLGYKNLSVSNIKMGDTLIASNSSDIRNGNIIIDGSVSGVIAEIKQDGTIPTTYGTPHKMTQLNALIEQSDLQTFVYTTPKNTQKITLGLQFNGLFKQNADGGLEDATVQLIYYYRPTGSATWIEQVVNVKNEYTIDAQPVIFTIMGTVRTYAIPKQKVVGTTFKISTSDGYKDGRIYGGLLQVYIRDAWNSLTYSTEVVTSGDSVKSFTAKTQDVLRYEVDIIPTQAEIESNTDLQWDIMVQRLSADDRERYTDKLYWAYAVYELGGVIMQQRQLDKVCLLGLKIKATEITNSNLDKISAVCQMVAPILVDGEWTDSAPEKTSNPAAVMRQVLKGDYMYKPADDSLIDYVALNKLYAFCQSKSFMCNGVISEQETLSDILQKILGTCRTEFYIKNGMYSSVIDDVQPTPVAILSPKNSSDFSWSRQFGEKIDCYSCKYQNADQDFDDVVENVYPYGEIESDNDFKQELNIWGVNNHNQIFKIARYMHAVNALRREMYNLTIPLEHFALSKGQRVLVSHDIIGVGICNGYIKSYNSGTNIIEIDEIIGATDPLKEYGIQIAKDTGVFVIPCEVDISGRQIHLLESSTETISAGDFYAFGELDKITEDCVIVSKEIQESPQLSAKLTLKAYAPDVFNADIQPIPAFDANITNTNFDLSMIATGSNAEIGKITGSSVKDDGILYFDFTPEDRYFDDWRPTPTNTNRLYNYGTSKENGDAICHGTLNYTTDTNTGYDFVSSTTGGYFTACPDTALYGNFSISVWLKGSIPTSIQTIMQILDEDNYLHFTLYFNAAGALIVNLQDVDHEITGIDYSKIVNGSHLCLDYSKDDTTIKVYQDGIYVTEIDWGDEYDDEGIFDSDSVSYDDEGIFDSDSVSYDDEGIFEAAILGKSHTKHITFLRDEAGLYPCSSISIARLRIYTDHINATGIWNLYSLDALYVNTNAESRYLGELKAAPSTGFLYEFFKYVGAETDDYLYGAYYQRTLSGWRLLQPMAN